MLCFKPRTSQPRPTADSLNCTTVVATRAHLLIGPNSVHIAYYIQQTDGTDISNKRELHINTTSTLNVFRKVKAGAEDEQSDCQYSDLKNNSYGKPTADRQTNIRSNIATLVLTELTNHWRCGGAVFGRYRALDCDLIGVLYNRSHGPFDALR